MTDMQSGTYEWRNGQFVRIGETEELLHYRGEIFPKDDMITTYSPSMKLALYSTPERSLAMTYAGGEGLEPGPDEEGQLYVLKMKPKTIAIIPGEFQDEDGQRSGHASRI